jgi:hypothetical protein
MKLMKVVGTVLVAGVAGTSFAAVQDTTAAGPIIAIRFAVADAKVAGPQTGIGKTIGGVLKGVADAKATGAAPKASTRAILDLNAPKATR